MIEIFVEGNINEDLERNNIEVRTKYENEDYSILELTEEEYNRLNQEEDAEYYKNGAWVYGSFNLEGRKIIGLVNDKPIKLIINRGNELDQIDYFDILEYISEEWEVGKLTNIALISNTIAELNNLRLSELYNIYMKD